MPAVLPFLPESPGVKKMTAALPWRAFFARRLIRRRAAAGANPGPPYVLGGRTPVLYPSRRIISFTVTPSTRDNFSAKSMEGFLRPARMLDM